nr:uncharacterized protein [Tanacetum cinerariifolium]
DAVRSVGYLREMVGRDSETHGVLEQLLARAEVAGSYCLQDKMKIMFTQTHSEDECFIGRVRDLYCGLRLSLKPWDKPADNSSLANILHNCSSFTLIQLFSMMGKSRASVVFQFHIKPRAQQPTNALTAVQTCDLYHNVCDAVTRGNTNEKGLEKRIAMAGTFTVIYVIEFQKRGLPHVHILLWLEEYFKCSTPAQIYDIISTEIPSQAEDPEGYKVVTELMLHDPCGKDAKSAPCNIEEKCSKHFPKTFNEETTVENSEIGSSMMINTLSYL